MGFLPQAPRLQVWEPVSPDLEPGSLGAGSPNLAQIKPEAEKAFISSVSEAETLETKILFRFWLDLGEIPASCPRLPGFRSGSL